MVTSVHSTKYNGNDEDGSGNAFPREPGAVKARQIAARILSLLSWAPERISSRVLRVCYVSAYGLLEPEVALPWRRKFEWYRGYCECNLVSK